MEELSLEEFARASEAGSRGNARATCCNCGAFVSDEQAKKTGRYDYWGEWDGPFCEQGKGCNRTAEQR